MKPWMFLPICLLLPGTLASAAGSTLEETQRELEELNLREQQAFVDGHCDEVLDLLADDITFFMNGRKVPKAGVGMFCQRIPRPFEKVGEEVTRIHAMAPGVGYVVKTMTFPGTTRVEVVTKIWEKEAAGWKMRHFHSTVMDLEPPKLPNSG